MSARHPHKANQKKARSRKSRKLKVYNPPVVQDDLPERPEKPKPMSRRQRDALAAAIIMDRTGLGRIYAAMGIRPIY